MLEAVRLASRTLGRLPRRELAPVLATSAVMGASEGAGLAMLVPIVAVAGGGAGVIDPWPGAVPLPVLLCAFVAVVSLRAVADLWLRRRSFEIEVRFVDGLRDDAFAKLLAMRWRALSAMRPGQYRAALITSIERCGDAVAHAIAMVRLLFTLAALLVVGLFLSPLALFVTLVAFALVGLAFGRVRREARRLGDRHGPQYDAIHSRLGDNLDALRLVKARGAEPATRNAVGEAFAGLRRLERRWLHLTTSMGTALQVGGSILLAALAYWLLHSPAVTFAETAAILALLVRFVPQAADLMSQSHHLAHSVPAFAEIDALVTRATAAAEPVARQQESPVLAQHLVLSDVAQSGRGGKPVLTGLNLHLAAGSCTAITGASGAGKSTLADILSGLIAPEAGRMAVDGVPVDDGNRRHWRSRVALLDQHPILLSGSVRDNLLFAAPDADDALLREALICAQAGFVFEHGDGLDTTIGEAGRMLSGGEKQRLCLARALLSRPRLLILDEATSGVDPETERAIAQTVTALAGSMTIVIIAHRGHMLDIAQTRLHLEDGRLHPVGSLNAGLRRNSPGIHGLSV